MSSATRDANSSSMSGPGAYFVRNAIRFGALLASLSLVLTPEETLKSYMCTLIDEWFGRLQQTQACFDLLDRCPFPVSFRIVFLGVATALVILWRRSAPRTATTTEQQIYRESGTDRGGGGGCGDASNNKQSKTSNAGGPSPSPPIPTRKRSVNGRFGRRGRPAVRGSGSTTTTTAGQMINGDMNMNVSHLVMNYNARDPWRVADVENDFETLEETNEALSARHATHDIYNGPDGRDPT